MHSSEPLFAPGNNHDGAWLYSLNRVSNFTDEFLQTRQSNVSCSENDHADCKFSDILLMTKALVCSQENIKGWRAAT